MLNDINNNNSDEDSDDIEQFNLNQASAFLFHSPYCKLVQKSFARLLWNDYLEESNDAITSSNTSNRNENELSRVISDCKQANLDRFK